MDNITYEKVKPVMGSIAVEKNNDPEPEPMSKKQNDEIIG